MGLTTQGVIDFARNEIDVSGSFVPAYQVNTMLTKIPLVGLLLSGGQNEGVFGLSYRVHGPMSGPLLTINPLSAMAPGILRKILGAVDGTASHGAADPDEADDAPRRGGRAEPPAGGRLRLGRGRSAQPPDLTQRRRSDRPEQHMLLSSERQFDDAAAHQGLPGDERLFVAERRVVDPQAAAANLAARFAGRGDQPCAHERVERAEPCVEFRAGHVDGRKTLR